jgi:hypothetical protein
MAVNLARVQGRCAVTLHGGARVGARAWRLVTAIPGRPGHQPAGIMTGARGASLEVPHRLAGNPPRELVCHEAWPRLSLGMNSPIGTEPWWDAERRARSALRAPHPERCGGWIRVCRRSASLLSFRPYISWLEAQIVRMPVSTAGVLWRRSGRRAKKFLPRDDDSGADRIARTIPYVVIAGLLGGPICSQCCKM